MKLDGVVVAVTGGGSGIGAALAEEAAARNAGAVAVLDLDINGARAVADRLTASGTRAAAYQLDIADVDAVATAAAEVADELGVPGLVCANAGVSPEGAALLDADARDVAWALSVNVIGTWATLRSFGSLMASQASPGWMLVTASEHAIGVPFPGNGVYTTTKHAVFGMADVIRRELPEHLGISVMVPGLADTGLWRSGRTRPESLGGPQPDNELAHAVLARGMDPQTVAARALDGVARGGFVIATHHHAARYADARTRDVTEAFASLEESDVPAVSYDVTEIVTELTGAEQP